MTRVRLPDGTRCYHEHCAVSVVIKVGNSENETVLAITCFLIKIQPIFDLIIYDNGSIEKTLVIVRRFQGNDNWQRSIQAGIELAKYIQFLFIWNDPAERTSRNGSRCNIRAFFRCETSYLTNWLNRFKPFHPE